MKCSGVFRVGFFSAMLLVTLQLFSQGPVPGTNINMVSGTQFPGGDPYLQRQNEPSMAVSTRNPQHLLAGANDYRSVDIPFPPDSGMETGDAWLGVFTSIDGGQTWSSTLLPGFPQDQSPVGMNSPLHGFAAATDPTVRAGTHGLFYYSGLVFNRGNNAPSGVFVASFQDQNNKGNGAGAIQQQNKGTGSPFLYLNASLVDTGTSGQFLDKPWIAVDIPRPGTVVGSATCTDPNGKSFTSGNVYVFYTKFNGSNNNPSSSIQVVTSKNCGNSWSKPVKISQSAQLNQGTVAAVDPGTGTVYVFWRQLGNGKQNQPDAILYASSSNGGGTWNTGTAYTFPTGSSFDESADSGTFREADLPAAAVDGSGRVWLAVSQRNLGPLNTSRIIVTTMPRGGSQKSWTAPFIADNSQQPGHQFMPALSFAYGKLMLTWYDNREDHTKGVLQCPANMNCTKTSDLVEMRLPITGTGGVADSQSAIFAPGISDTGLHVRHTIDVRGALVDPTPFDNGIVSTLAFPSARISQYTFGSRPCSDGSKVCSNPIEQLQFNPPNFPMFTHGTKPFIGDYIDVAALTMLFDQASGKWVFNTSPSNAAVFHATWTDNRDVRPPPVTCNSAGVCTQNWALYTAVGSTGGQSFYDPSQMKDVCVPGQNDKQTGSRNQNVYTARITQGLLVGVKENTKPLVNPNGAPVQRAFSVFARNTTNRVADYRFTVNPLNPNQNLCTTDASGTTASFFQTIPPAPFSCVNFVDVIAMPRSTVSRTLFVNSTLKYPSVSVTIAQIDQIGGMKNGGPQSTTAINPDNTNPDITNPDITNPDITNPDITNPDITNPDIANAEVYDPTVTNPDITNPDITNPDITNPDITNPDITNPDITNPDINNMVVTNPDITNPDITNPDITNPDITNPDITNPDINSLPADGINDVTFKLNNKGNTSSSYSAKEFARQVGVQCCPAGCPGGAGCPASCTKCQLIARKIYPTPIANACKLMVQAQNIPISNIPDPAFTTGGFTTPDNGSDSATAQPDATISLGPGEGARVTLRVFGPVDSPQAGTGTTPVKTVGISGGADTGQNTAATSLTITTTSLPVAVVGTDYETNSGVLPSRLMAVGGIGATSWSTSLGTLPAGVMLTSSSGQLSGTVADSPGAFDVTFRVDDSLTPTSNFDLEKLTIDVNKFSISSVSVANTNGSLFLKAGDVATVRATVSNEGPATATNVQAAALVVNASAAGTPSGPTPLVNCQPAQPAVATLIGNSSQEFDYTCTAISGNGFVTFSAGATAVYANSAATVPATAAAVTSNAITVDTTPPALVVTSVTVPGAQPNTVQAYTPGTWTNQPVTVTYSCVDNLSGVAAGTPFITVLNPAGPIGTIMVSDPLNATASVTLTAESSNSSVSATCADVAGNPATPPPAVAPIMIDKTAPQISVAATTPNGAYLPNTWTNQIVTVVYTCNDTFSPVNANSGAVSPAFPLVANVPDGASVTHAQMGPNSATTTVVLSAETAGTTLSASCSDVAANPATALPFGPIMIDKTPPTVVGSATTQNGPYAPGVFTNQPVTVTFGCQDTLSGPVPSSIMGNQVISGETNTNVQGSCQDVAGNTGTTSFGPVEVDMIGPAISISSPGPNQVFLLNQPVTPNFSCVEGAGGIDQITSCVSTPPGAFVASPVGSGTFTVNAADQAGNTAQQRTNYLVTYNFIGFQSPLQLAGTAAQPSNSGAFVQGAAIPLQWQLQDFNQAPIIDPTALVSVQAFPNPACSGPAPANAVALTLFSNGAPVGATNTFQVNQAGQFVFTWDTTNIAFGCYNLAVTLNDTVSYVTIVDITSVLVNIAPAPGAGDLISRGFYLPSYPGSTLSQATLAFSSRTAGTYTFSLTAHSGAYDGPVIGTSQATAVLDGVQDDVVPASFSFPELSIVPQSTVAFVIQQVSGPSTGDVFYSVSSCDFTTTCAIPGPQVIETNGTTPPLDTFRRNGVGLKLLGAQ